MNASRHAATSLAVKVLAGGGLALAAFASWSATARVAAPLGVSVTVVDTCMVGTPAGSGTSWVCTNGTTATLAFGLNGTSSGAYRPLASATAVNSTGGAQGEREPVRLTLMFVP